MNESGDSKEVLEYQLEILTNEMNLCVACINDHKNEIELERAKYNVALHKRELVRVKLSILLGNEFPVLDRFFCKKGDVDSP